MDSKKLKDIKKGEFVKRKIDSKTVFIRGEYCRYEKRYELIDVEDINRILYFKGNINFFIGFDYQG